MKRILSIKYSSGAFNLAMLALRLGFGIVMLVANGLDKLQKFAEMQHHFYNFLHLGSRFSLVLAIFAEIFCSLFLVLGLFTRLAVIPLIITMLVIILGVNAGKPLIESDQALIYLSAYLVLLLCGPGKISVDGLINK